MHTELLKSDDASILRAAECIKSGGVVAFPTETVYGLGANGLNPAAVHAVFAAKERPADNPLILHISRLEEAEPLCFLTEDAKILAKAFWPGPLTMLLKKKPIVPDATTAGLETVAIRMPKHPIAQKLISACALPIAAPSANRSGRPSPTTAQHVLDDMAGRIDFILDGGPCEVGVESTVLDMSGSVPTIYRPGAVTPEQISMVIGECKVADNIMKDIPKDAYAPSPGMRHKHYAPKAEMLLVNGKPEKTAEFIKSNYREGDYILAMQGNIYLYEGYPVASLGEDAKQAAHRLFYLLRETDKLGAKRILSETLPYDGLGLAVMNRLARAAAFRIIEADK
ncbi:MAG: L-threonylcarbamoyladenylate synthase [Eubacteriales bacterium]|nr:L-threonylcarbamoyladenylate synthase [Eubacteriales bacterium]